MTKITPFLWFDTQAQEALDDICYAMAAIRSCTSWTDR